MLLISNNQSGGEIQAAYVNGFLIGKRSLQMKENLKIHYIQFILLIEPMPQQEKIKGKSYK